MKTCIRLNFTLAALLVLSGSLTGCASYRSNALDDKVGQIRTGTTTRAEIEDLFGPPKRVEPQDAGRHKAEYVCSDYQDEREELSKNDWFKKVNKHLDLVVTQHVVQVLLDPDQIVEDFEYSQRNPFGQSVIRPWGNADAKTASATIPPSTQPQ